MVWFRVDDNLAFHPKVMEAGNSAMGLWVRAGAWSAANLTDGFVPTRIAFRLGSRIMCYRLVEVGLFEEKIDGFQFHDWDEKNFTKQQVEERRQDDRKRKDNQRKRHLTTVTDDTTPATCHAVTPNVTDAVTPPVTLSREPSAPSLPSPTLSGYVGGGSPVGNGSSPNTKPPPPRFCPNHPDGTTIPCHGCQVYRKNYEVWLLGQDITTKKAIQAQARAEAATRQAEVANCPLCDNDGYRNNLVCDHIDHTQTHRNGSAAVREVLNEAKAKRANQ